MSEFRGVLERLGDRVAMPEPALERLTTRRRRRDRNRRIGTAALALILAAAASGSAIAVFRAGTKLRPTGTHETSTITPQNAGDLGLAWTAGHHIPGSSGLGAGSWVVRDGSLFLSTDRLYKFRADCRSDGGACEPSWTGPSEGPLNLDGDTLYAGYRAYDLTCTPDPCLFGDVSFLEGFHPELPFPCFNTFAAADGIAYALDLHETIRAGSCARDPDTGERTCGLLWTADLGAPKPRTWSPYEPDLVVADGKVFTSVNLSPVPLDRSSGFRALEPYRGLFAFDSRCRDDGGTCQPLWVVHGSFGDPVAADGVVYVVGDGLLQAFPEDCGTSGATCRPLWVGRVGTGFTTTPVVANGVVYVGSELGHPERGRLSAFSTTCTPRELPHAGIGRLCDPLWTTDLLGLGGPVPILTDGKLAVGGGTDGLSVFTTDCGLRGGVCHPLWTSEGRPVVRSIVVSGGVVYLAERGQNSAWHKIDAYDLDCRADSDECEPSWSRTIPARIHFGPVVGDGGVYVGGGNGTLYVFRVGAGGGRGVELSVLFAGALMILLSAVGLVLIRRRRS